MDATVAWLSNASANLVGSLIGAGFGVWLAIRWSKRSEKEQRKARKHALVTGLVEELTLIAALLEASKDPNTVTPTPITWTLLKATTQEQIDLFESKELQEMLPMVRWHLEIINQDMATLQEHLGDAWTRDVATRVRSKVVQEATTLYDKGWLPKLMVLLENEIATPSSKSEISQPKEAA